ncbi:ATP-dependent helicase [Massilia glaciei]|uniref:ATP-dependent helicase n=2 Tax=Massilia glaciei TaxID=1524097 RepID=A0A2U2HNS0_9BURK|nr:ATP-dependent helicase [Massilia glaciei]
MPGKDGALNIDDACTCGRAPCEHVAAVLIELLRLAQLNWGTSRRKKSAGPDLPVRRIAPAARATRPKRPEKISQPAAVAVPPRLFFALLADPSSGAPVLAACYVRMAAKGGQLSLIRVDDVAALLSTPPFPLEAGDRRMIDQYLSLRGAGGGPVTLSGSKGAALLEALLEAGKLVDKGALRALSSTGPERVLKGPPRTGELAWRADINSLTLAWRFAQAPGARDPDASHYIEQVLPTDPPWYVHQDACGVLMVAGGAHGAAALSALVHERITIGGGDAGPVLRQLCRDGRAHALPVPDAAQLSLLKGPPVSTELLLGCAARPASPHAAQGTSMDFYDYAMLVVTRGAQQMSASSEQSPVPPENAPAWIEELLSCNAPVSQALARLGQAGFAAPDDALANSMSVRGALVLPSSAHWLAFAHTILPELQQCGWKVRKMGSYRYDVLAVDDWYSSFEAGSGQAWFDLEIGIIVGGQRIALLPILVKLIQRSPGAFTPAFLARQADDELMMLAVPDGPRVALPWGRIKLILGVLDELYFSACSGAVLRLSPLDAARVAQLAGHAGMRWHGGERLSALEREMHAFDGVTPVAPPATLQASLRHYQREGLSWMQFLRQYNLAGILADDMGLGKTVQTLAHILVEKEAGRLTLPALVVAPTSLMGNWQDEAARFAPGLKVLLLHGAQRHGQLGALAGYDLVLTTYALMSRDEDALRRQRFHLLILDEAQYIKNPRSRAAQTACLLNANHRLCLTGTPLQNHLGELWSQFHFLLPGLLGREPEFNRDFRQPIEQLGDTARNAYLVRRIKPFLLRRTKDVVAKELPPKTTMMRFVELSGMQRDLYETVRVAMDKKVRDAIAERGAARSHIVVLEALLKLRQVCCDPRLLGPERFDADAANSAKLAELLTMLDALLAEGRKVLVFSQFTSMLALIETELAARDIAYVVLTGHTRDRADVVRQFQHGAASVFLISLKAGGVGLNLTAADTVIHYDPWWNPAAEDQASDRAWRIGQDKPVFVYKLIVRDTLEEKIQLLQEKKASMAAAVLDGEFEADGQLSADDLRDIFAPLSAPVAAAPESSGRLPAPG